MQYLNYKTVLRLGAACTRARNAAYRIVESVVQRSVPACLTLEKYEDRLQKDKCAYVFHLLTKLRRGSRKSLAEILMNQTKFTRSVLPWICKVAQHKTDSDTLELLRGMKLSGVASEHSPACLDLPLVYVVMASLTDEAASKAKIKIILDDPEQVQLLHEKSRSSLDTVSDLLKILIKYGILVKFCEGVDRKAAALGKYLRKQGHFDAGMRLLHLMLADDEWSLEIVPVYNIPPERFWEAAIGADVPETKGIQPDNEMVKFRRWGPLRLQHELLMMLAGGGPSFGSFFTGNSVSSNKFLGRGNPWMCGTPGKSRNPKNWKGELLTPETHGWCFEVNEKGEHIRRPYKDIFLYFHQRAKDLPGALENRRAKSNKHDTQPLRMQDKAAWAKIKVACFTCGSVISQGNMAKHHGGTGGFKKCASYDHRPTEEVDLKRLITSDGLKYHAVMNGMPCTFTETYLPYFFARGFNLSTA